MSLYVFRYVCECILNVEHVLYESLAQKLGWQFTGRSKYESYLGRPGAPGLSDYLEKMKVFRMFDWKLDLESVDKHYFKYDCIELRNALDCL